MAKLTVEKFEQAGKLASELYNDEYFAVGTLDGEQEDGTVVIEMNGEKFEVWLTKYFKQHAPKLELR